MTTGIPSGLGATLGWAPETTVGTFVAPTIWTPFQKEALKYKKNVVQSKAIHGGLYNLRSRRAAVTHGVSGAVNLDLADRNLSLLFQNMLGAAPTVTAGTGSTNSMVFVPGSGVGMSMSAQVGRPLTSGTIQAFSYNGLKVTDWELSVQTGSAAADLTVTFDGWNEDTTQTYAAPSWITSNILNFTGASLILGGTASTTSGVTSVATGTTLATARSVSIKGTNGVDTGRYFLGANGTKAEQLPNAFREITGSVDLDFANTADVLTAFYSDAPLALQLQFTGPLIATGVHSGLTIIIPSVQWDDGAAPNVAGPDVLHNSVSFSGLDDQANNIIQFTYVTLDTAP